MPNIMKTLALILFIIMATGLAYACIDEGNDNTIVDNCTADYYSATLVTTKSNDSVTWTISYTNISESVNSQFLVVLSKDGVTPVAMYGYDYNSTTPYYRLYNNSTWGTPYSFPSNGYISDKYPAIISIMRIPYTSLSQVGITSSDNLYYGVSSGIQCASDKNMTYTFFPSNFTSWDNIKFTSTSSSNPDTNSSSNSTNLVYIGNITGNDTSYGGGGVNVNGSILNKQPSIIGRVWSYDNFDVSNGKAQVTIFTSFSDDNGVDTIKQVYIDIIDGDTGTLLKTLNVSLSNATIVDDVTGTYLMENITVPVATETKFVFTVMDESNSVYNKIITQIINNGDSSDYKVSSLSLSNVYPNERAVGTFTITNVNGNPTTIRSISFTNFRVYDSNGNMIDRISSPDYTVSDYSGIVLLGGQTCTITVDVYIPSGTSAGALVGVGEIELLERT